MVKRILIATIFGIMAAHAMNDSLENKQFQRAIAASLEDVQVNNEMEIAIAASIADQLEWEDIQTVLTAENVDGQKEDEQLVTPCCVKAINSELLYKLAECPHCGEKDLQAKIQEQAILEQYETTNNNEQKEEQQKKASVKPEEEQDNQCMICFEEKKEWFVGPCAHKVCTDCKPSINPNCIYRDGEPYAVVRCPQCRTDWDAQYNG